MYIHIVINILFSNEIYCIMSGYIIFKNSNRYLLKKNFSEVCLSLIFSSEIHQTTIIYNSQYYGIANTFAVFFFIIIILFN